MKWLMLVTVLLISGCGGSERAEVRNGKLYLKGDLIGYSVEEFEYKGKKYIAFGQGDSLSIVRAD